MKDLEFSICGALGLQPQAVALLALLSGREWCFEVPDESDLVDVNSYAWYNGREKCVLLVIKDWSIKNPQYQLFIVFGENRSSDNLFIDCWCGEHNSINPPRHESMPEEAYNRRRSFGYAEFDAAESYILELIKDFVRHTMMPLGWI